MVETFAALALLLLAATGCTGSTAAAVHAPSTVTVAPMETCVAGATPECVYSWPDGSTALPNETRTYPVS